ncbi:peptidase M15 [Thiocapsa imhoffii]|uniref:Peptidase M15 n=1 Tax=Thiocapsa imhoffii TaxID=382777 RepID=A0A9X0WHH8_9GAMM|nr:DNA phosphorothioation-associated putative methyltransferase [Thiocapsa imhoffii]MBK1644821.1 peptidase M15 [Thiocapsa imhoffii]
MSTGKTVAGRHYLHRSLLERSSGAIAELVARARERLPAEACERFDLVRVDLEAGEVAFLHYPAFFEEPFPALRDSWRVLIATGEVGYRTYADSLNPPILHRKELMLAPDHPQWSEFAALTEQAESIGLFDDPKRIGYRRQWDASVAEAGYRVSGHTLVPLGNLEDVSDQGADPDRPAPDLEQASGAPGHVGWDRPLDWEAARQRTAMVRYGFSAPMQTLARHGFLDGRYRVFDYGCGRGDDVRGLRENGLMASGWDPYFAPDEPIVAAEIVNLGFVINVIEDFDERVAALTRAWSLAEQLLVVSVMLANQNDPRGERFRDGVMTQRGTFQKYFTQAEIKAYLEQVLDEEPIPVAPGVLYVFRDKDAEQRFLVERYASRRNRLRVPILRAAQRPERQARPRRDRVAERYAAYREPLERLWSCWLELGRTPDPSEVADLADLIEGFGSLNKALRLLETHKGAAEVAEALARAEQARSADLEVYFALQQFSRRRPYKHLDAGLQRDIKAFFGDYPAALETGRQALFRIADTEAIAAACQEAAEHGLGWLDPGRSLQLDTRLVEQLPALLRVYVGAAAMLYGDIREADLVKIHIGSGKLTLLRFDDFDGHALPRLIERVKIKLREQDIDYFAYGERFEPPYLYHKSRYLNEEYEGYPEQVAFEDALEELGLLDWSSGYGPEPARFDALLARQRWVVEGCNLVRARTIPDLDEACGRFLTYRQLIACGETQAATGLENCPREPESYTALCDLATQVLDPVIEYFGMIRLTYGFCSAALAKAIPGRIDPKRDQHAAHERNRLGHPICSRLGAAVDFIVEDEDMLEVARWVASETPFDRLYVYGEDQPIHVSHGPDQSRQVVLMRPGPSGRLVPRCIPVERFVATER